MKTRLAFGSAILACAALAASPASADRMMTLGKPAPAMVQIASYYAPSGTIFLADGQTQMIRFSSPESHAVCLSRDAPAFPPPQSERHIVPMQVSWADNDSPRSRTLYPGECTHVQTGFVMLSPADTLGEDEALQVTVHPEHGAELPGS